MYQGTQDGLNNTAENSRCEPPSPSCVVLSRSPGAFRTNFSSRQTLESSGRNAIRRVIFDYAARLGEPAMGRPGAACKFPIPA
jgi:hypothetical protein